MAWYPFNFYKALVLAIIFILNDYFFKVYCFNPKDLNTPALKTLTYNNLFFNSCVNIENNLAIEIFKFNVNYYKNNLPKNFEICNFLYAENNILYNFKKNSCYYHPHIFLNNITGYNATLQFSHNKFNQNFKLISNSDLFSVTRDQYINSYINIYQDNFLKNFYNLDSNYKNETLKNYINYDSFLLPKDNLIKCQKYLNNVRNKNEISVYIKNALNL